MLLPRARPRLPTGGPSQWTAGSPTPLVPTRTGPWRSGWGHWSVDREPEADETANCLYDWETETARCGKILEQVKEMMGEENQESIKEVDCAGDSDRVFINIRRELDPFFLKSDN